jgi:hypothetical protein
VIEAVVSARSATLSTRQKYSMGETFCQMVCRHSFGCYVGFWYIQGDQGVR